MIEIKDVRVIDLGPLFKKKGGITGLVDEIIASTKTAPTAVETPADREEIASIAYKLRRAKTGIDDAGKALGDGLREQLAAINSVRADARSRLDAEAARVRQPLDKWESDEEARVAALDARLKGLARLAEPLPGWTSQTIQERLDQLDSRFGNEPWDEYLDAAEATRDRTRDQLQAALDAALQREAEKAELEALRLAEEERRRQEAEAAAAQREAEREAEEQRRRREAADQARREAEEKAAREAEAAQREADARLAAAEEAKAEAERRHKAELERVRLETEEQARREAEAAELERRRKVEAEEQERIRREADKRHRAKVRSEATAALRKLCGAKAEPVLNAIEAGDVPNVTLNF